MDLQRQIAILASDDVTVGVLHLAGGKLTGPDGVALDLAQVTKATARLKEPFVFGCLGVVALGMAVTCGGIGALGGPVGIACGASTGLVPLAMGLYAVMRAPTFDVEGARSAEWALGPDPHREECELLAKRINRDVAQRGKPMQHADVLFEKVAPTEFPLAFTTIVPIPLDEARRTKVGDAQVEAKIAVAVAAWRVSFAADALPDVIKWGIPNNAIFGMRDAPPGATPPPQGAAAPGPSATPLGADALAPLEAVITALKPPANAAERRRRTWTRLLSEGHRAPARSLPFLPAPAVPPRTPEAIAERARIAFLLSMAAQEFLHTGKIEQLRAPLEALSAALSPSEAAFLRAPDKEAAERLAWMLEDVRVLAWAAGWITDAPSLTPQWVPGPVDADLLGSLRESKPPAQVVPIEQVVDAMDYIYCARWIAVDTMLKGKRPERLEPGVLLEQHRALGWLTSPEDWDAVSLST